MWLYSLLGLVGIVLTVGVLGVLVEEVIALTGGVPGVVVIDHCDAVNDKHGHITQWDCSGLFRSRDKALAIDAVSIYLDKDDLHARPGLTVNAKVAGSAASQAVVPGDWGSAVGFLIVGLGFAWLSWWSIYEARRVRRAAAAGRHPKNE